MNDLDATSTAARDYRVVRTDDGLRIEVLDYHAEPLTLTGDDLKALGLEFTGPADPAAPRKPAADRKHFFLLRRDS